MPSDVQNVGAWLMTKSAKDSRVALANRSLVASCARSPWPSPDLTRSHGPRLHSGRLAALGRELGNSLRDETPGIGSS